MVDKEKEEVHLSLQKFKCDAINRMKKACAEDKSIEAKLLNSIISECAEEGS